MPFSMPFVRASLLFVVALLADASIAEAKHDPAEFLELAGLADLIVVGEIAQTAEDSFTLRVDEVLAGVEDAKDLRLRKFVDYSGSQRWKPYAVGQREVAFLRRHKDSEMPGTGVSYGLFGFGAEAEWEIVGKEIAVQDYRWPGGRSDEQRERHERWFPLDVVLDAIRHYRSCFSIHDDGRHRGERQLDVRKLCTTRELEQYRQRSLVHDYLVRSTRDQIVERAPTRTPGPLPPDKLRR